MAILRTAAGLAQVDGAQIRRKVELRHFARIGRLNAVVVIGLAVWELIARLGLVSPLILPPLELIASRAWELLRSGELLRDVGASLGRVAAGYCVAVAIAVPLGLAMGWWRRLERLFDPLLGGLRAIPPVAWIPIAILWFGVGNAPAIFIVAMSAFPSPLLAALSGVRETEKVHVAAALTLGASPRSFFFFWRVVIPGALPTIVTGLRVAIGYSWTAIIAAELIAARTGLGYMMVWGGMNLQTDRVVLAILLIGGIGFLLDHLFSLWERRAFVWRSDKLGA